METLRPVHDYMTPLPHTIGVEQSLIAAATRMHQLGIRHLPVLHGGALVGIVSDRDVSFVRELGNVDSGRLSVEDIMTPEPFVVGPEMPLSVVARAMADRKVGCAIVIEHEKVVGILTTTDALSILAHVLMFGVAVGATGPLPSEVRSRILDEHRVLRSLLDAAKDLAERVLAEDRDAEAELFETARDLYRTLLRHLELEDAILAAALLETDVYGPARVEALQKEHRRQRIEFKAALATVDDEGPRALARSLQHLVPSIRKDMEHEERDLLNEKLLKDDLVTSDSFTG